MRGARAAWLLGVGLALGAAAGAEAAEPTADSTRIGVFRVEAQGGGIEVWRPRDRGLGLALLVGGALVAGLGQGLRAAGRRGAGTAAVVLGLGFAAVGGVAVLGGARWRANGAELVRERIGGRIDRWPRAELGHVEVVRRGASAEDFKRPGTRPWDVLVRSAGGAQVARFSVASERDARALASALAGALGAPIAGP